jgi:hypothetical protein
MENITKIQSGFTISDKEYVFTGDATIIDNNSAHIVTDRGIKYVNTSATVGNQRFANINALLTSADFNRTIHNTPEPILLASEFTQAQADAIAINSAKVGIASAGVTSGNLTISLTDGTTPINAVNVVGPTGPTGPAGPAGTSGINGIAGGHVLTKPISGRTYSVRTNGVSSFTYATMTANTIILSPFIPANTLTISNLIINVPNATVGALARILVYSDLNGSPSSKLIESTDLDASRSGDKTFTQSYTFTAGTTYWLGVHTNIALSLIIIEPGNAIPISSNSFYGAYYTTNTSATFKSAPATLTTSTATLAQGYPPSIILTAT